jgi:DNA (cytosine-5)-methyltransferase 1
MGYHQAGFDVCGVDLVWMDRYPFQFFQMSALALADDPEFLDQFDAIAASPPCKVHTSMKAFSSSHHVDLVPETRELLIKSGKPWVMENVPGAPLIDPVTLCGSMFGLNVRRHRLFESNIPLTQPECRHEEQEANSPGYKVRQYHSGQPVEYNANVVSVYGRGNGYGPGETELWRSAMQMPWASKDGLAQAIPPAYTEFIGRQLIAHLDELKGV